jgi:transposase
LAQTLERLCTIPGVKRVTATAMLAEIGTDMSRFASPSHLASWAGMCPGNNQSAGKRRKAKARSGDRWLRTALVESGHAASRARNTALAAIFRRNIVRHGPKHAAFVVGRHILEIAYQLIVRQTVYHEIGPAYFEQRRAEQVKRRCLAQLQRLGFQTTLTPLTAAG